MGRLASDIGGTFTDLVYFDETSGDLTTAKLLTTPSDLTEGVIDTVKLSGLAPEEIRFFVHGGTTVINAITERKGVKTALVTTAGFRDVLEIQRGNRPDLYNLRFYKERPFVPRRLRFEVRERVSAEGEELTPLNRDDLASIVERCREEDVEAIAVQFLHSYIAPNHEEECAAFLRDNLPNVAVTASSAITRDWREYDRANTTVLNAYVQPIVERYFGKLEVALGDIGIDCPYSAMQSNGGTTSFEWAKEHPITLLESGPAAGCNGAALVGAICGLPNVIYLDIGGTTAKCSDIEDGKPKVSTEYRLEWSRTQFGYPLRVPVVEIVEIGAGGGSIAWFDKAGLLKVGPMSAGADPGPACYARGGTEPTVTDAKLITGVLNPDYFAAGQFRLDIEKAREAMTPVAERLRCGIDEAAVAVIRPVDANMINALKLVSIQRGHDPRDFALIVGGGGGAMHASALGRELGVKEIIIPTHPGLFSAWGMLATEPRRDFMQTVLRRAEDVQIDHIHSLFDSSKEQAARYFASHALASSHDIAYETRIDLRYLGQEHTVTVPLDLNNATVESIIDDFHNVHERTYTFRLDDTPVEFVTYRLTATAHVPRPKLRKLTGDGRSVEASRKGERRVDFGDDGVHSTVVYERDRLPPGFAAVGPLIIEEPTSTTLVHPEQRLEIDDFGFIRISNL
ncbi:MAG: hydantoinase/oxoprolinase family protein [Proteobacteria bacterium]|nr:hydantoinase/oxoprolinase family protein [Pseudomonadota bacterium]